MDLTNSLNSTLTETCFQPDHGYLLHCLTVVTGSDSESFAITSPKLIFLHGACGRIAYIHSMKSLINLVWRLALRVIYPLARLYWTFFDRDVQGTYVLVWSADQLLMIRNSYRRRLNVPGGMVNGNEEPIDAAVRELFEEAGVQVTQNDLTYLGQAPKKDPKGFGIAHMFEAELAADPLLTIDNREVVWAGFMEPKEALGQPLDFAIQKYLEGEAGGRPAASQTQAHDRKTRAKD